MPSPQAQPSPAWIHGPLVDLIIGCGAWSLPLILLSYSPLSNSPAWAIAFYALALVVNYPHYMSTLYRAYARESDFQKYRVFTIHITLLVLLTAALSHVNFVLLPWIFTLYLTLSPWHYSGQNYGLFMMFVRRSGAHIDETARQAAYCAFVLSYAILFLSLHTGPSDRLFLSIGIPERAALPVRIVLSVAFVAASAFGLSRLARQMGWKAMLPPLVLFSSQVLWFLVPGLLALTKGITVTQSRYSTGVLPLMHSAQYLWITSYYARRESAAERKPFRPWKYFGVLIVGGIALFVPGPWLASYVFHYDFTSSFLIFTALVNLHHFILDGAIWKLRDGRIAAILLGKTSGPTAEHGQGPPTAGSLWGWVRRQLTLPRPVRVTAVVAVLALAVFDQARNVLLAHAKDLASLQTAAAMNPFDAPLETAIANRKAEIGDASAALAAYQRAVAASPWDLVPRKALIRYLAASRHYPEADVAAKEALQRWPNDSELLLNEGIVVSYLGREGEAVAYWERSLEVRPRQPAADLYLAEAFEHQQKYDLAAEHYTAFLDTSAIDGSRPQPEIVLPVLMKLAACNLRLHRNEDALKVYDLGRKIAGETGQARFESVASLNQAVLESNSGRVDNALRLYQKALQLDRSAGDRTAEAADWQAFAVFLHDQRYANDLAYACLVRAERLLGDAGTTLAPRSQQLRSDLESSLGHSVTAIRRNPDILLDRALQMTR